MTQKSHCWAYTPSKPEVKETHVPPVFIATLLTTARAWKQPRCPLADEWIESCGAYTQWNITQLLKRMHLNQF